MISSAGSILGQTDTMYLLTDGMIRIYNLQYILATKTELPPNHEETDEFRCWDILQDQLPGFSYGRKKSWETDLD